jgi:DNA-binding transcriptional regulator YiaG
MKCLQKTVHPVAMPYKATARFDGQLYELDIPDLQIAKCSNCGELDFSNRTDDQITAAFRNHWRLLAPQQIQEARINLGLSRQELAERIGTTEELLSKWEEDLMIQPRAMENLLRLFFALPAVRSALTGASQDPSLGLARRTA